MVMCNTTINSSKFHSPIYTMNREYHIEIYNFSNCFTTSLAVCFMTLMIGGIFFNLVLGYTIITVKKLRTLSNVFIINLAISDFITATATVSFDADLFIRGYFPYGIYICGLREVAFMMSLPGSVGCLFLLSIERFVTISLPYKRNVIFTKKNVSGMIIITWSYTLSVALFPIMHNPRAVKVYKGGCGMEFPLLEYGLYQVIVNFLFPAICIILINIRLLMVSSRHSKMIRNQSIQSNSSERKRTLLANALINIKAVKTIVMLVGVFSFCWLTFIIMVTANILCGVCHPRELTWIGNAINYSSIVLNPLVYGFFNRRIRKQIHIKLSMACIQIKKFSFKGSDSQYSTKNQLLKTIV